MNTIISIDVHNVTCMDGTTCPDSNQNKPNNAQFTIGFFTENMSRLNHSSSEMVNETKLLSTKKN